MTKSWKIHSLPLSVSASQILSKRELQKEGDYVFTNDGGKFKQWYLSKRFREYVDNSGLSSELKLKRKRRLNKMGI